MTYYRKEAFLDKSKDAFARKAILRKKKIAEKNPTLYNAAGSLDGFHKWN